MISPAMHLRQTARQTTALALTPGMQMSIRLLQMTGADLLTYLAEQANANPYLELRLPAHWGGGDAETLAQPGPGLHRHIADQIDAGFPDPRARAIAFAFLDALDPSGWLSEQPGDIAARQGCAPTEAEAVLVRLQEFDPVGVFARSLAECLRLQAAEAGFLDDTMAIVLDHVPLLAANDLPALARLCGCSTMQIDQTVRLIRGLNPKPGQAFTDDAAPVFPPDLTVRRWGEGWQVDLNRSTLPELHIAPPGAQDDRQARAEARALMRAFRRRQVTVLRVARAIIAHQQVFLDYGAGHLRPLSLTRVADDVGLHVSTVSRAIAGRMIDTPRGVLPLKALFSRAVAGHDNRPPRSQDAVAQMIRTIIRTEDRARPLSDQAIARQAATQGLNLARRTVAKYRDALGIAPSHARRQQP